MKARPGPINLAGMRARLVATLTVITTMSVLALGLVAMIAFDRSVEPEVANRTRLIGTIVRSDVERGLELGIPLERLEGLSQHLTETLRKFAEVDRIAINTASGLTIAEVQSQESPSFLQRAGLGQVISVGKNAFSLPILDRNQLVGSVIVEVNPQFVETRLREVFLDILVIALIAMVFAVELVLVVTIASVGKPLDRVLGLLDEQGQGIFLHRIRPSGLSVFRRTAVRLNDQANDLAERLAMFPDAARARMVSDAGVKIAEGRPVWLRLSEFNDIRLTLFFFSLAAEITASFLPLYSGTAARPDWVSPELAAAAPLMVYLVAVAALSPFGGRLARRFGPRVLFLAAVPPTVLALVGMGMSETLSSITGWRALTGVSYAAATIACQEYAFRAARDGGSARPAGAFIAVIFGGVFCGSALGGVVAGRFGFEAALYVGASIAILSGILGMVSMSGRAGDPATEARVPANFTSGGRGGRPLFLALLFGIVAPMNASTAIFIWYLTPIMLAGMGYGASDIARVVMLYYFAVVLLGPTVTRLSDGRVGPAAFIIMGSVVSGLALLSIGIWEGLWAVTVCVAGLGLGHTLIRAPQYALAVRLTGGSSRNLGALRLVERLGALSGLTCCALYLSAIGAEPAVAGLGMIILTGSAAFAIVHLGGWRRSALLNITTKEETHVAFNDNRDRRPGESGRFRVR
ncbi:MFS transporter [Inquilinus sp. CAU 1745]|uniref:MFS transporter n=1 Tax=Inquilinus sp. CAU 1745 TaxID=3140369 RepID=UPI00325A9CAD